MASKRVTLKWRKVKGEWRAGPFTVWQRIVDDRWDTRIDTGSNEWPCVVYPCETESEAKRACERLAARILGAKR